VDGGFGQWRKVYRKAEVDTVQQFVSLVDKSSNSNVAVPFTDPIGLQTWQWRDWRGFLGQYFKGLPGIRKCHHFKVMADKPGTYTYRLHTFYEDCWYKCVK